MATFQVDRGLIEQCPARHCLANMADDRAGRTARVPNRPRSSALTRAHTSLTSLKPRHPPHQLRQHLQYWRIILIPRPPARHRIKRRVLPPRSPHRPRTLRNLGPWHLLLVSAARRRILAPRSPSVRHQGTVTRTPETTRTRSLLRTTMRVSSLWPRATWQPPPHLSLHHSLLPVPLSHRDSGISSAPAPSVRPALSRVPASPLRLTQIGRLRHMSTLLLSTQTTL
jgi:hypothetical protein